MTEDQNSSPVSCVAMAEEISSLPTFEPLVHGLLPAESLGILIGRWGLGKSPLLMQLALSLAGGRDFLGHYVTNRVPVIYHDFENGKALMIGTSVTIADYMGISLPDEYFISCEPVSTRSKCWVSSLIDYIDMCSARLLIIDPLRSFDPNAEERNSNAQQLISKLRQVIRETGVSILITHHVKKADRNDFSSLEDNPQEWMERASGAFALISNTDFRIGVDMGRDADDEIIFRAYQRIKGWGPVQTVIREFNDDGEPVGYRLAQGLDRLSQEDQRVYQSLPAIFRTGQFRSIIHLSSNPANIKLKAWLASGVIKRTGRGLWQKLTPEGNANLRIAGNQ